MNRASPALCPSVTGKARDAQVIGFVGADGMVASISTPIPLTDTMRETIGPQPERKFRLAGACSQGRCVNWRGQACGLIDRMRDQVGRQGGALAEGSALPSCGIRSACVWWRQAGIEACRVCSNVVYNPAPVPGAASCG